MESIYPPETIRTSEPIELKEYFTEYNKNSGILKNPEGRKDGFLLTEMNIPNFSVEDLRNVEKICSIDALTCDNDFPDAPVDLPENVRTRSRIDPVYTISEKSKKLNAIKCREVLQEKYSFFNLCFTTNKAARTSVIECDRVYRKNLKPGAEYVLTILFYRPFNIKFGQKNSVEKIRLTCEIEALGSNTLVSLVDKLPCPLSERLYKEVEDTTADVDNLGDPKKMYPSQSLFIDGVFYNDLRSPNAIDYSSKVIQWAKNKGIGKFKSESMDKITFDKLKPRLGYPYLFMHQGDCEHLFVFSDARMLQETDCLSAKLYPRMTIINRSNNILCYVCGVTPSNWLCTESDRFPHSTSFLCTECCKSYNYIGGQKVGDFKLFPFSDSDMF